MVKNITTATDVGGRPHQEDRFFVREIQKGMLLAVMDGHGGDEVAEYVAQHLELTFRSAKKRFSIRQALFATYEKLHELTESKKAGTTLSLVWVPQTKACAHVAILGDSLVAIQNPNQGLWISPEHNVLANPIERTHAQRRGAVYLAGYIFQEIKHDAKGLAVSRSLGDANFGKVLDRVPEVFSIPIRSGSMILLATDGVCGSNDPKKQAMNIRRLAWMAGQGSTAAALVADASLRGGGDNATAIVYNI